MNAHPPVEAELAAPRRVAGVIAGLVALGVVSGGVAYAEPVQDSAANVNEMFREAEHLSETILNAQPDLDKKMQLLSEADQKHADDLAGLELAKAQLATYQDAVDSHAAAVYMGGRTDGMSAFLTASSPSTLIHSLAMHRVMGDQMAAQLQGLRRANDEAQAVEAASAQSEAAAQKAVDEAAAFRADLQNKRAELRNQLATVNASYAKLPAAQQAGLTLPSAAVTQTALGPIAPIPTVGMAGIVPNARILADYIMATYPGVQSIGGVRADALPDHPSGHALDIMIGSDMALGDAIHADLESQSARFNIKYTMWRVPSHFNHVHVTVF